MYEFRYKMEINKFKSLKAALRMHSPAGKTGTDKFP